MGMSIDRTYIYINYILYINIIKNNIFSFKLYMFESTKKQKKVKIFLVIKRFFISLVN